MGHKRSAEYKPSLKKCKVWSTFLVVNVFKFKFLNFCFNDHLIVSLLLQLQDVFYCRDASVSGFVYIIMRGTHSEVRTNRGEVYCFKDVLVESGDIVGIPKKILISFCLFKPR